MTPARKNQIEAAYKAADLAENLRFWPKEIARYEAWLETAGSQKDMVAALLRDAKEAFEKIRKS